VIFVAGLASLTEANRVFLPGEPVKSSLDLVERALYAKVPSRRSSVTRAEHVLDGERGAANKAARQAFLRLFVVRALLVLPSTPIGYIVF